MACLTGSMVVNDQVELPFLLTEWDGTCSAQGTSCACA